MATGEGGWVALFSGGKDSSWALAEALRRDLPVERLLTMVPPEDSWLFHVPGTQWTDVLAEAIGIPVTHVSMPARELDQSEGASAAGDREAAHLADALSDLDDQLDDGLDGIVSGAVASEFQHDRLERLSTEYGIDHFAPLWGVDPATAGRTMVESAFDIRIVAVAAAGLDRSWLGRRYDEPALRELSTLAERYGVHHLGEGGEFETLVLDGPHMQSPVSVDATVSWDGDRGHLEVTDARCDPPDQQARLRIIDRS